MTLTDGILSVFYVASIAMLTVVIVAQMRTIAELREEVDQLEKERSEQVARACKAERALGRELAVGGALIRQIKAAIAKFIESQDEEDE